MKPLLYALVIMLLVGCGLFYAARKDQPDSPKAGLEPLVTEEVPPPVRAVASEPQSLPEPEPAPEPAPAPEAPVVKTLVPGMVEISPEELAAFTMAEGLTMAIPPIANAQFEEGRNGWNLPAGHDVRRGEGRNGTWAMTIERNDAQQYAYASQRIPLPQGLRCRLTAWVKVEDVRQTAGGTDGAAIALEFYQGSEWVGGQYHCFTLGTTDWLQVATREGAVPDGADSTSITLYLSRGAVGKAWFDDVRIETLEPMWTMAMIRPSAGTLQADNAAFTLRSIGKGMPKPRSEMALACRLRVKGAFSRDEIHRLDGNGDVAVAWGQQPTGEAMMTADLLDLDAKQILATAEIPLRLVAADAPVPAHACLIDDRGFALVDGKPFVPVGLYVSHMKPDDIARFQASPFNTVMPYCSLKLTWKWGPDDKEVYSRDSIRQVLDACHAADLKVIYSIMDVFDDIRLQDGAAGRTEWLGVKGADKVIEAVVSEFKNHPSLLAWYVNDERPLEMRPALERRRQLVNRLDPHHPTWAVFYQFEDVPLHAAGCDILGVDPYPVKTAATQDMKLNVVAKDATDAAGLPCWDVPQVFNWGKAEGHRDPTEEEMRAMWLYMALRGATGFIGYSYFDLQSDRASFEQRWAETCRVGQAIQSLVPAMVSRAVPPTVTVEAVAGTVEARAWADDEGRVKVVITGIGPGKSEAIVKVDVDHALTSEYGGCERLPDGRYRFTGMNICSDILSSATPHAE